jgi:NAD-dependent dihydropyrimidine dehydrogenase PreA subunit
MMQVDLEKCTGCGECLESCPVEAISMIAGRAAIDADTCLGCGACVQACKRGAISESRMPVPARALDFQPHAAQTTISTSHTESRLAWAGPMLSYVGREIVPRVVDSLIMALDRRLSSQTEARAISSTFPSAPNMARKRHVRRRRRGRNSNLKGGDCYARWRSNRS